jgi:pyruvate/2-oxoglutarate dehydrogenase complex dihydrolipoamide dehydrogenase (E3) component
MGFDILLLCTGALYSPPIKDRTALTLVDRKKNIEEFYNKVQNATNILVVGSGLAGVEMMGEFAAKYGESKEKNLTLMTRSGRLLASLP